MRSVHVLKEVDISGTFFTISAVYHGQTPADAKVSCVFIGSGDDDWTEQAKILYLSPPNGPTVYDIMIEAAKAEGERRAFAYQPRKLEDR